MSKRLILILALAFVVGLFSLTYAEVQNVKVSGDIDMKGVLRNSLTLQDETPAVTALAGGYGETITAILSTVRLRVDADLTDNVSTTIRLLNERDWNEETNASTDIDLDLAYVTLKEFLYSPLTLTLGRQELRFGNALIIGDPDTNGIAAGHNVAPVGYIESLDDLSSRKAFDAIRATLNYDPLVVDFVYAKIDENGVAAYNDIDLYGVNAAYTVNRNLNTEVYLWQRNRDAIPTSVAATNINKAEHLRVAGVRGEYTGIKNLKLGLESAFQFGEHVANATLYPDIDALNDNRMQKVTAYALQAYVSYVLPAVKSPVATLVYTYLSGNKYRDSGDDFRGWNPMFEDQGGGMLINKIACQTNAQYILLAGGMKPMEDVTLSLSYLYARVNQPFTVAAAAVPLSGVIGDPTYRMQADEKYLGSEVDLGLTYDYTEDVQFKLNTGAFMPGSAFDSANKKTATQVIGSMKVTF